MLYTLACIIRGQSPGSLRHAGGAIGIQWTERLMKFEYDAASDTLAIRLAANAKSSRIMPVQEGVDFGFDADGQLVVIQIAQASTRISFEELDEIRQADDRLTLVDAASEVDLDPDTLRSLIHKGRLRATKQGRDWIVSKVDLHAYLESRTRTGRPRSKEALYVTGSPRSIDRAYSFKEKSHSRFRERDTKLTRTLGAPMPAKKGDVHTVKKSEGTGWVNKVKGEVVSSHRTQENAAEKGRTIARQNKAEHVIHGRDGKIREKNSYGKDPMPPRDKG